MMVAPIAVATVCAMAVIVTTIGVRTIVGVRTIHCVGLFVGDSFGSFQKHETTGQED
jgi:hypothetical protein